MITLEEGQLLLTDEAWAVELGGEYEPNALVECIKVSDPSQKCAFYALYIASGEFPE